MREVVDSPVLLVVCLAALVLASLSWIASVQALSTPRTRVALQRAAVIAVMMAILIVLVRFVALGG